MSKLGLKTVGDLASTPAATLQRALGQAAGAHLSALAWGRDERRVVASEPEKSVGAEETFGTDVDDPAVSVTSVVPSAWAMRDFGGLLAGVLRAGDLVILMLPNSPDVEAVALGRHGLREGVRAGQTVVDMSTISPIVSE